MSALVEFLYPAPARRTALGIVSWWERRRLAYNALVGGTGLVTLSVITTLQLIPPFSSPGYPPWEAIVVYGIAANLGYSLGWIVELAADKLFGGALLPLGPVLHRMGLTFALGLTLLPALVIGLVWIVAVIVTLFGPG